MTVASMPVTPFHFGPGAALHALAPRHISFLSFCVTNVFIDLESLYNLVTHRYPVHAFLHTYIGATLAAAAVVTLFVSGRWIGRRVRLPNLLGWEDLSALQIGLGAALGASSHVMLDSLMHPDIQPLAPLSSANGLLSAVSLTTLHLGCVALGALGVLVLITRRLAGRR